MVATGLNGVKSERQKTPSAIAPINKRDATIPTNSRAWLPIIVPLLTGGHASGMEAARTGDYKMLTCKRSSAKG